MNGIIKNVCGLFALCIFMFVAISIPMIAISFAQIFDNHLLGFIFLCLAIIIGFVVVESGLITHSLIVGKDTQKKDESNGVKQK